MDKIQLLQNRKKQLYAASEAVRADIAKVTDKDSFVELSAFSFSKNDFYGETAEGEGVVTGFATIEGYPFYIVAQNPAVLSGGVSKANTAKIEKCLKQALQNTTPVLYLLSSKGVQIGEGANVLEGIAALLKQVATLKGVVPQYLVVNGEVYGQIAVLAAQCDFTFFLNKQSVLAANSPLVLSAKAGVNLAKESVGGSAAFSQANLVSFTVESLQEVKEMLVAITELLATPMVDSENLNQSFPAFNKACTAQDVCKLFDKGTLLEVGADYQTKVHTVLGRIGGIAVAAVIFEGDEGVALTAPIMRKLTDFAEFANFHQLPYVTFVNTLGIEPNLATQNSLVLKEIAEYITVLEAMEERKLSVIYGKAIGLGYTLFAAKEMGYSYTYAFATAQVALFDSAQGAEITYADDPKADKAKLAERYSEEHADPIHAAKGGYIDGIIEPAFVKQYVVASLQTLLK